MKKLLVLPLVLLTIMLGCKSDKDKSKESSTNKIQQTSFDVNKADTWPVKFSDYGFTPLTYANAESYAFMQNFINRNGVNNIFHFKTLSKAEDHWVVSPNNDVLYSMVTVDCSDDFLGLTDKESKYTFRVPELRYDGIFVKDVLIYLESIQLWQMER